MIAGIAESPELEFWQSGWQLFYACTPGASWPVRCT
jgi:hypothetical protein